MTMPKYQEQHRVLGGDPADLLADQQQGQSHDGHQVDHGLYRRGNAAAAFENGSRGTLGKRHVCRV